jgi:glyoxylase-like metal-dependent hydrolase (beta-lactamase superfamily II)
VIGSAAAPADPAYETYRQVTAHAGMVLAANPGPLTLEGTNTWLLRAPGSETTIVIDPGPLDETHLAAVAAAAGRVEQILLTHNHPDHSDGARRLAELTGAPVRALDPEQRLGDDAITGLGEGDVVAAAGIELRVWATPGHSSDSLSFVLDSQGGDGVDHPAVLTGDTILGRGTTVVAYPDGQLGEYLASLRRLSELDDATVLPGHGPELAAAGVVARYYLAHRHERLEQVRVAVAELGQDAATVDPMAVVEVVYADVDKVLWPYAEKSVRAQLAYLQR